MVEDIEVDVTVCREIGCKAKLETETEVELRLCLSCLEKRGIGPDGELITRFPAH